MAYRVEISREAEGDALEAFVWIGEQSFEAATRWFNGLMDAIMSLQEFSGRCSLALENDDFADEIRQLIYGKRNNAYRILFTIKGEAVSVLYIRHTSRDRLTPRRSDE